MTNTHNNNSGRSEVEEVARSGCWLVSRCSKNEKDLAPYSGLLCPALLERGGSENEGEERMEKQHSFQLEEVLQDQ